MKNICEWPAAPLIWSMAYEFFSVPKSGRITAWKVSKYGVISGPYFHAFGLNTERYFVSLHIQSQCRTRNYSVFGQFPCSEFSALAQNSAEWKTTTSTLSFSSILRNSTVNFEVSIKIRTMSLVLNEFYERFFVFYLRWRDHSPAAEKKFKLVELFFSRANKVWSCATTDTAHAQRLYLTVARLTFSEWRSSLRLAWLTYFPPAFHLRIYQVVGFY